LDIRQSYELPFPVADLYAAWISSATVISPATAMEIEPVVGGLYRLIMDTDEGYSIVEGRFQLVLQNRKLRYTWEWNHDGEVSTVEVAFSGIPTGTRIDIHHSEFDDTQSVQRHAAGWDSYIEGLAGFLTVHQGH